MGVGSPVGKKYFASWSIGIWGKSQKIKGEKCPPKKAKKKNVCEIDATDSLLTDYGKKKNPTRTKNTKNNF